MNRFIETLLIITFLNGAFSLKFEKSFTIPKIDEFSPVMASDWSIVRLISRRLYVENNTAFSISLECNVISLIPLLFSNLSCRIIPQANT